MKAGVPAAEAEIVAGLLVRSDLSGVETHGVPRLPFYIQRLQMGIMKTSISYQCGNQMSVLTGFRTLWGDRQYPNENLGDRSVVSS
jgi:LDH2 family malate/lactate/ureidoglycolate dehydrogenase